MEFELKDINKELSDVDERYYLINLIAKETIGREVFPIEFSIVYDAEQKAIFDFIKRPDVTFFMARPLSVSYKANDKEHVIDLININNGFRHTGEFKKFYEMHKVSIDIKFNELIRKG